MEDDDPIPPKAKKEQLERMLASPRFRRHKKPSKVFFFLVTSALDGKTPSAKDIFYSVFPAKYDEYESHARTAMHTLRREVREYYENEGQNDQVIIGLPVRERGRPASEDVSYPVTFAGSDRSRAITELHSARQAARHLTARGLNSALQELDSFFRKDTSYLPVKLFYIECLLAIGTFFPSTKTEFHWKTNENRGWREDYSIGGKSLILHALKFTKFLAEEYPDNTQVLCRLATAHLLAYQLGEARTLLSKIETLHPNEATSFLPRAIYYLVATQHQKQIDIFVRFLNADNREPSELLVAAFCIYLSHGSSGIFHSVFSLDPGCYIALLGRIYEDLPRNEPLGPELFTAIGYVHELSKEESVLMPGLILLAYERDYGGLDDSPLAGKVRESLVSMDKDPLEVRDWIQIALASLGTNPEESVAALASAVEHRLPLALFLPIWPIFDPLREREDFKRVLDRLDEIVGEPLYRFRSLDDEMP